MYYIEDQDPILVKNEVILDQGKLRKYYQEITLQFGRYLHRSYDGEMGPYSVAAPLNQDFQYIKNYEETKLDGGLTHYEYDEYCVPELAKLIAGLLDEDVRAIDAIKKGPSFFDAFSRDEGRQEQLQKELQDLLNATPGALDHEKFHRLTEEIGSFYKENPDKEQREELQACYKKVLDCIRLKPVMTLYKDKLNEFRRIYRDIQGFYEGTNQMEEILMQV